MFFISWHVIESLLHKAETLLTFLAKSLFHKIACLLSEVNKYTGELSFGSLCNTWSQSAQMSTELSCLQEGELSAKIDNIILFSISLNFLSDYSGIKSTNEIHVIHKEIIIKRCTNIILFPAKHSTTC